MTLVYVWLGILTLALAAHMLKDAKEFRRIDRLEALQKGTAGQPK